MNARLPRWVGLALLAIVLALSVLGAIRFVYEAGRAHERVVWQDKERKAAEAFARQLAAEVERGLHSSIALQQRLSELSTHYITLEGRFNALRRRIPLVLPSPACTPRDAAPAAAANTPPPVAAAAPRLSLGAVWLWNSALAGTDVPAGACGPDGAASDACAADAGLTVEDAWDNHLANARSCAADRARHRALIEFLGQRTTP